MWSLEVKLDQAANIERRKHRRVPLEGIIRVRVLAPGPRQDGVATFSIAEGHLYDKTRPSVPKRERKDEPISRRTEHSSMSEKDIQEIVQRLTRIETLLDNGLITRVAQYDL